MKWFLLAYVIAALAPFIVVPLISRGKAKAPVPDFISCEGTRATILATGQEAFDARMNLISNAEHSLDVGAFVFADDSTGSEIAAALLSAADRGVHVRILLDGLSGRNALAFSNLGYALSDHENIEIRLYNPPNLLKPWALNVRYHEKYIIVDERILVLGGRNLSDDFLTPEGHPRYNYDMDVLVFSETPGENGVAAALTLYFDTIWQEESKPAYLHAPFYRRDAVQELKTRYRQQHLNFCTLRPDVVEARSWENQTHPVQSYALMVNPIRTTATSPEVWDSLSALMRSAHERVWIQTPYLVLDGRMWHDLEELAHSSIENRVLTNSRAGGNNLIASSDMLLRRRSLLRTGVEIFTFQGDASMHTKTMLIDRDISVFGSFNFDMRSAYIDTEVMLMIQSEGVNRQLEAHMQELHAQSLPMDPSAAVGDDAVPARALPFWKGLAICLLAPMIFLIHFLV